MKKNSQLIWSTILCLLPVLLGIILYKKLPDRVAIHWDFHGVPNNFAPRGLAVFGLPVFMTVINFIVHYGINKETRNPSAGLIIFAKWSVPALSLILVPMTYFIALGNNISVHKIVPGIVGLVIIACGIFMPKLSRNKVAGFRIKWTLENEENWNKTHKLAGKIWVIGGILLSVGFLLELEMISLVVMLLLILIPAIYSYILHRRGM